MSNKSISLDLLAGLPHSRNWSWAAKLRTQLLKGKGIVIFARIGM